MNNYKLSVVVCPTCGRINVCTVGGEVRICPVCESGPGLPDEIRIELSG